MTKTKLLTSTALVSAVALAGAAGANAATLKLGGFAEFWVGYGDNEKVAGVNNNFDTKVDGEIYFRAEETLDNGIKAGVLFELEAFQGNAGGNGPGSASAGDGTDGFDETFGWIKTKWGQVNVGNNDLATGYVGGVSTVGPVGIIKSDAGDWIPGTYELNNTDVDLGLGDSQNITYFTPRFMGAQLIVSYTPDSSEQREDDFDKSQTSGLHNGFSVALKYSGSFQNAKFSLAAGRTVVENSDGVINGDEREGYNAAGRVSVGAFTLTGAWAKENAGHTSSLSSDTDNFWGVSGLYKIDKNTTVSIAYGKGEETDRRVNGVSVPDNDSYVITGGIERKVGKGVSFAASIFKIDGDQAGNSPGVNSTSNDRDGVGVVGGMVIKF